MPWTGSKEDLKAYRRSYYERNGEAIRAKNRERNRTLTPETRRRHMLSHRYGITMQEFDAMVEAQEGACAICGDVPTKGVLTVDHDHDTGVIRGLLCRRCNSWLSLFENERMYAAALAYLGRT